MSDYGTPSETYSQWERRSRGLFPDPFVDITSVTFPTDIKNALWWCERLLVRNVTVREALEKIVSYFITDVEILSRGGDTDKRVGREEKEKYLEFLHHTLHIKDILRIAGLEMLAYGNCFVYLHQKFRRYLDCPNCHTSYRAKQILEHQPYYQFSWRDYHYHFFCPACKRQVSVPLEDVRDEHEQDEQAIVLRRLSPFLIDIDYEPISGECEYFMRIPDDIRTGVMQGQTMYLLHTPKEVIEAVRENTAVQLDKRFLYHLKEESFAGLRTRGWGMSRLLTSYPVAWYVQLLLRSNEQFALDWVVPIRVITPHPQMVPGDDNVFKTSLGSFTARMFSIIRAHRMDPARWNVVPVPVEYKLLGGEASALSPVDLINNGMDMLLNGLGIPVQLYKGDLTLQQAPAAMRILESRWAGLVYNLNCFLDWVCLRTAEILKWERVRAQLQRAQHADDLNRQMARLQLMTSGMISRTTGLKTVGLDAMEEEERKLEEERLMAEKAQKMQEEMEQAMTMGEIFAPPPVQPSGQPGMEGQQGPMQVPGGPLPAGPGGGGGGGQPQPPPQGAAPGAAPGQPTGPLQQLLAELGVQSLQMPATPEEWSMLANQLAIGLIRRPYEERRSILYQIKQENPILHDLVTKELERLHRTLAQQGKQQQLAQMQAQPGPPQPM